MSTIGFFDELKRQSNLAAGGGSFFDNEAFDLLALPNKANRPDSHHVHLFPTGPEMAATDNRTSIISKGISVSVNAG